MKVTLVKRWNVEVSEIYDGFDLYEVLFEERYYQINLQLKYDHLSSEIKAAFCNHCEETMPVNHRDSWFALGEIRVYRDIIDPKTQVCIDAESKEGKRILAAALNQYSHPILCPSCSKSVIWDL